MKPKYNRILLKLSGESLAGDQKTGIDFDKVVEICKPIKKCVDAGVQVGIVVGGGNFWRGRSSGDMVKSRFLHMIGLAEYLQLKNYRVQYLCLNRERVRSLISR